jgi:leader peptidase (prepilin peptidase)/N-methyltransferase
MTTGLLALLALAAGLAMGPLLDRLGRWSLREASPNEWRSRPLLTGGMAGLGGALAVLLLPSLALAPAWIALAWIAAPIVRTDLARHRIPDVLNLAAITAGGLLLLIPWDAGAYGRAWLAALAVTAGLLALALITPSGLGMGDVKLAPALGLYLGYLGWGAVLIGVVAGFVLGAWPRWDSSRGTRSPASPYPEPCGNRCPSVHFCSSGPSWDWHPGEV